MAPGTNMYLVLFMAVDGICQTSATAAMVNYVAPPLQLLQPQCYHIDDNRTTTEATMTMMLVSRTKTTETTISFKTIKIIVISQRSKR